MIAKFEVYQNKSGEFHWRPTHLNGKIIADMERFHKSKVNTIKSIWGEPVRIDSR